MRRRNIIAAAVLIVCGLIYGYLALGLPERSLPNTPGPSFFPYVVTVFLLALSIALLVQALRSDDDGIGGVSERAVARHDQRRLGFWALLAILLYIVLLPILGFIIATLPFFAVMMVFFGERRPLIVVIGAVAATGILYSIFRHGFGVFLPRGLLTGIVA